MPAATALIAEDEPLLARELQANLAKLWPELQIVATVGDGLSAVQKALELQPDILFFDIQMPGQSGLDAAMALLEDWPQTPGAKALPRLVFVTAYDQYAVQAFEAQAVDYLLKPIKLERLTITVNKLNIPSTIRQDSDLLIESYLSAFRSIIASKKVVTQCGTATPTLPSASSGTRLKTLQVSLGHGVAQQIKFVPLADVLLLEATDKYLQVVTAQGEYLLRTSLKELLPQLDEAEFWQIHRGTVVQVACIDTVRRDEGGKLWLSLHGHAGKVAVSRLWVHRFKAL